MGLIPGRVTNREVKINGQGGHPVMMLQVVVSDPKDVRQCELVTHHGAKSSPPNGSRVVIGHIGRNWPVAIACDDLQAPGVNPGESRYYSTDADGNAVVAQIYFKNDGTMEVSADTKVNVVAPEIEATATESIKATAPQVTVTASSKVSVVTPLAEFSGNVSVVGLLASTGGLAISGGSGAVITGNMSATGTITGTTDVVAGGISGKNHTHVDPQGGSTDPPS
jgi:phage gp45-like